MFDEASLEEEEDEDGVASYSNRRTKDEIIAEVARHKIKAQTKKALATTVETIRTNILKKTKNKATQRKNLKLLLNTYEIPHPDPWSIPTAREWLAVHYITHGIPIDN
jgi:hypothetical protein